MPCQPSFLRRDKLGLSVPRFCYPPLLSLWLNIQHSKYFRAFRAFVVKKYIHLKTRENHKHKKTRRLPPSFFLSD